MSQTPMRVAIIEGSTREGRFGPVIGHWFVDHVARRDDFEVDYIDLAPVDLPAVLPASYTPEIEAYVARLGRADAFVVITPEYNHGYPASLKQAIDLAHDEWIAKPVAFISYGARSGGIRAAEQLRQVFAELHTVTVRDAVSLDMAWELFDESGQPLEPEGLAMAADRLLDQLAWWAAILREGRATAAYPA